MTEEALELVQDAHSQADAALSNLESALSSNGVGSEERDSLVGAGLALNQAVEELRAALRKGINDAKDV